MSGLLRFPVQYAHGSWVFGAHMNADGTPLTTGVKETAVLDEAFWIPSFRDLREPLHLAQGGTLGRVHKGLLGLRLRGRIREPDAAYLGELADRERAMRAAFDPYQCYLDSPTTDGAYALDYSSPTTDTATYASGRIALRRYMRPVSLSLSENLVSHAIPFDLVLSAADPREYEQTEQTITLTPASASQAALNRGNTSAPWKATITMAGAGSATFGLDDTGDALTAIVLDLSGMVNNDVVVVYGENSGPYGRGLRVTKNGVDNFALKTSTPATWFSLLAGSRTIAITNHTNVTSCVFAWRSARA